VSYRCSICLDVSPPGAPRLLHIEYRSVHFNRPSMVTTSRGDRTVTHTPDIRQEIAREVPVCKRCKKLLDSGEVTFDRLVKDKRLHRGYHHKGKTLDNYREPTSSGGSGKSIGRILRSFPKQ